MKLKLLTPLIATSMLLISNNAFAVLADDVVCTGCIQATDIADGAIVGRTLANNSVGQGKLKSGIISTIKLKNGAVTAIKMRKNAVTTDKIVDGAVSELKLSTAVQTKLNATGGGLAPYSIAVVTATKQVYALTGDFTTTGGATACQTYPGADTEVRNISRTDLGGGNTQIDITRQRLVGGEGGTSCHYQKIRMIRDANDFNALFIIQREKWDNSGTTLIGTDGTEYDAVDCNESDCGILLRRDGMSLGILVAADTLTTSDYRTNSQGVNVGHIVLVSANVTDNITINGTPESATGCNDYKEIRDSEHFGKFSRTMVTCATVGRIFEVRRTGDGKSQFFELIDYTAP